jgi:hypothetical protein
MNSEEPDLRDRDHPGMPEEEEALLLDAKQMVTAVMICKVLFAHLCDAVWPNNDWQEQFHTHVAD